MRTVAVIQARMGSTRLPGKSLARIAGRPLALWTVKALSAVPDLDGLVVAVTEDPADDELARVLRAAGQTVHRGSVRDVLSRCWEAVSPLQPDLVIRETADNPFVDPEVVAAQVRRLVEGGFDYVGTNGWPLGIAAEAATASALETAYDEAADPAEREHVMPFLYSRPERFRIGSLQPTAPVPPGRFTVDTEQDLAFARAIADRLGDLEVASLADLGRILAADPELLELNRAVPQKAWQEAER